MEATAFLLLEHLSEEVRQECQCIPCLCVLSLPVHSRHTYSSLPPQISSMLSNPRQLEQLQPCRIGREKHITSSPTYTTSPPCLVGSAGHSLSQTHRASKLAVHSPQVLASQKMTQTLQVRQFEYESLTRSQYHEGFNVARYHRETRASESWCEEFNTIQTHIEEDRLAALQVRCDSIYQAQPAAGIKAQRCLRRCLMLTNKPIAAQRRRRGCFPSVQPERITGFAVDCHRKV